MALKLYAHPDAGFPYTDRVPFTTTFDGRVGGSIDKLVYVRNDDLKRWYSDITVQAFDPDGDSMTDNSVPGFNWKLEQSDIELHPVEWGLIAYGNTLYMDSDIGDSLSGDIVTFLPVWVRVTVPNNLPIQNITDIILRVGGTEHYIA